MDQKIAYSLQNAEINEKVSRKFGYVRFFLYLYSRKGS